MSQKIVSYDLSASIADATGDIGKRSKPVYEHDARVLAQWMLDHNVTPLTFTRSHAMAYLSWLNDQYQAATVKRMISVARNIFLEQVNSEQRTSNPFVGIKSPKASNETPHTALTMQEAKQLLVSIDQSTNLGKRDYALIYLLVKTGIRRSECAALNIGDLDTKQGHHVATIQHGKGDKRRVAKIPVEVFRAIEIYVESVGRREAILDAPLFIGFDRWDRPTGQRVTDKLIERTVTKYGKKIGFTDASPLTPHDLRSTFITLALEGGASLMQVQYAAGHDDPRTTERYQKRKLNLDNNAVDYLREL